jgi:catechol 2,3-dioxygenase-like lactoylglutathione lyase family enzyme
VRLALGLAAVLTAAPALAEDAPTDRAPAAVALIGPALNVSQLDREVKFYVEGLGMKVLMQMGQPKRRETMLGFGSDPRQPGLILMSDSTASNLPPKTLGNGFDRLVLRISGLPQLVVKLRGMGYTISDVRNVAMGYSMAFASDPEGYRLELVESGKAEGN